MHHCVFATLEVSGDSKVEYKLSIHDIEGNWMFAICKTSKRFGRANHFKFDLPGLLLGLFIGLIIQWV